MQELRGSALQLLATGLAASPRVSGARSEHWPSIKIALEGLGLPAEAVSACKIWLLQVHCSTSLYPVLLQAGLLDHFESCPKCLCHSLDEPFLAGKQNKSGRLCSIQVHASHQIGS